jgi:rhodanese-related sulfurtransferase
MLKSVPALIEEVAGGVRTIDAATAKTECAQRNGVVIDIREPQEVDIKSAKGAVHVPRGLLEFKLPEIVPDHDRPLYLHCASGGRARLGAEQLHRLGYTDVTAISCGIDTVCEVFSDSGD